MDPASAGEQIAEPKPSTAFRMQEGCTTRIQWGTGTAPSAWRSELSKHQHAAVNVQENAAGRRAPCATGHFQTVCLTAALNDGGHGDGPWCGIVRERQS